MYLDLRMFRCLYWKTRLKQDSVEDIWMFLAQISMGSAGRGQVFLPGEDAVDERVCLWGHVNVIVHENKTKTRRVEDIWMF